MKNKLIYFICLTAVIGGLGFGYTNCGNLEELESTSSVITGSSSDLMTGLPAEETVLVALKDGTKIVLKEKKV